MTDLELARERIGASATLWAGPDGVQLDADGWTAFSGTRSIDYNVALCAGGGEALDGTVERVLATGAPTVIMVAGRALGEVARLVARSWTCIGSTPVMARPLDGSQAPPSPAGEIEARPLVNETEIVSARRLVADVFETTEELAVVALPDPAPDREIWGGFTRAGTLVSCLALSRVEDDVVVWSMASDRAVRRRGAGRATLRAALVGAAERGAHEALLYASSAGEPFYDRLGFRTLERWQMWSRPRWVLGRA